MKFLQVLKSRWIFYVLLLKDISIVITLQPLLGGSLHWSIDSRFGLEDRSLTVTITTAFVTSPNCSYVLGQRVICNPNLSNESHDSIAASHGILYFHSLSKTTTLQENRSIYFSNDRNDEYHDVNTNSSGIANTFIASDIFSSQSGSEIVVGSFQHSIRLANDVHGLLVWFGAKVDEFPDSILLPYCASSSSKLCSVSQLDSESLFLKSFFSGFYSTEDNLLIEKLKTPLFLSYIPLCTASNCFSNPIVNFHSPVSSVPPIFAVPVTDQSTDKWLNSQQPFHFKSHDNDGHKMTQFIPHNISVKCLLPASTYFPSDSEWPVRQCMGGRWRGMPCSNAAQCGAGLNCSETWSGCREFRDSDPDATSAAGNLLGFTVAFSGLASPFRGRGSGPLPRGGSDTVAFASSSILREVSQLAVYTLDYPWTADLGVDEWPAAASMPSWQSGSAAALAVFTAFPNDCGAGNLPPRFVPGPGSASAEVETERSCTAGSACEIVLFARDFASGAGGAAALEQTGDAIRVDQAAGFRDGSSLQRPDGSPCVGTGSLECIVTLVALAEDRVGSIRTQCFVVSDEHPPGAGGGAKSCSSLPLCVKIRLDAIPHASGLMIQMGNPIVGLVSDIESLSADESSSMTKRVNISWVALPSGYKDRISSLGIECSIDSGVVFDLFLSMPFDATSITIREDDFAKRGIHDYTFRVVILSAGGHHRLRYFSAWSNVVKLDKSFDEHIQNSTLFYSSWQGQVLSLNRQEGTGSIVNIGTYTTSPVHQKSTVIDSERKRIISLVSTESDAENLLQLLVVSLSDMPRQSRRNIDLLPPISLWNLELDEATGSVIAICINATNSMIVSIPVSYDQNPTSMTEDLPLRTEILSLVTCFLSSSSTCQILFSVSAFDRISRVYFYIDSDTQSIMGYSLVNSTFLEPVKVTSGADRILAMSFDDVHLCLLVFSAPWPSSSGEKIRLSKIYFTRGGAAVDFFRPMSTSLDSASVQSGSLACNFVQEYCLFILISGKLVKYYIQNNITTVYSENFEAGILDVLFLSDRTPVLRGVNPSVLRSNHDEITVYGVNFGLTYRGLFVRIGNTECIHTKWISDNLILCGINSLGQAIERIPLGVTIQKPGHFRHFENIITIHRDSWVQLLPTTPFITLAFGQKITFAGVKFLASNNYRCAFVTENHVSTCDSAVRGSESSLVFELPLWLGVAQETTVVLLSGQVYLGSFRPTAIVYDNSTGAPSRFLESWITISPSCLNVTSLGMSITYFGLGFDPARIFTYACSFLKNGNISAINITSRMVICKVPDPGLDPSWKSSGGADTAILVRTIESTPIEVAFYNSSGCTESKNCTCSSQERNLSNFLFIGVWSSLSPTIGFIGAGNMLTVHGFGFHESDALYSCSFEAGQQFWIIRGTVLGSTSLLCNTSELLSGQNLLQVRVRQTACPIIYTTCDNHNSKSCFIAGPTLFFVFKSFYRELSTYSASAAGKQLVTISGMGIDSSRAFLCAYTNQSLQIYVTAQNITATEIICATPEWPFAATFVSLQVKYADGTTVNQIEAEFKFEITHDVSHISPLLLLAQMPTTVEVWGAGFHQSPQSYICSWADDAHGESESAGIKDSSYATPINNTLILCENVTLYSSRIQLRISFQWEAHSQGLLFSSNLSAHSSWSSLRPVTITPNGGSITMFGSIFEGDAHDYYLTICLVNDFSCPWKNISAESVVEKKQLIFMLPSWLGSSGEAHASVTFRGNEIQHILPSEFSRIVLIHHLSLLVPSQGCISGNEYITFIGQGFVSKNAIYRAIFKASEGFEQSSDTCVLVNETKLSCITPEWPHNAYTELTLYLECQPKANMNTCNMNKSEVVAQFTFSFEQCCTAVIPSSAGAAKSILLSIFGIGLQQFNKYECRFLSWSHRPGESYNSKTMNYSASTIAVVHNSTLLNCESPVWQWPAGTTQLQIVLNDTEIVFSPAPIDFRILQEIIRSTPSRGSGSGRQVTVVGAGFHSLPFAEHQYACAVIGGSTSNPMPAINQSTLVCQVPAWKFGSKSVQVQILDITDGFPVEGQFLFFYAEGIIGLSVSVGPSSGGTQVYMIGEGFDGSVVYRAIVDQKYSAHVTFVNETSLLLIMPSWNLASKIVSVSLTDELNQLDAGTVAFSYFEVIVSRVPSFGLVYGSVLLVRGYGFSQHRNYTCKLVSQSASSRWMETRRTKPRPFSSSEIEFSIPSWNFSADLLNIAVSNDDGLVSEITGSDLSYEVRSAWISAEFDLDTSFVGGGSLTIHGAGFNLDLPYTCQLRNCDPTGRLCNIENSSAYFLPCEKTKCLRGPFNATDLFTIVCTVPAWLHQNDTAFLRVYQGKKRIAQVFASAPAIKFYGGPRIVPENSSLNAPHFGNTVLNVTGSRFGLVDISAEGRIGRSSSPSTWWLSNTQIYCMTPPASVVESGIPLIVSVSKYRIGTVSRGFTYDGPILEGSVRFSGTHNITHKLNIFHSASNIPAATDDVYVLSALLGSFAYVDLTIKARIGKSAARSTSWTSNSFIACKSVAGSGLDHSIAITVDQATVTREKLFNYDGPSLSCHSTTNFLPSPQGNTNFFPSKIDGVNFGQVHYSPVWNGVNTCAESTNWISDSVVRTKIPPGMHGSRWASLTTSLSFGTLSEAWSYDLPSHGTSGQTFLHIADGNALHSGDAYGDIDISGAQFIKWSSSPVVAVENTGCECSLWISDSSLLTKISEGIKATLRSVFTSGIRAGTFSELFSYDKPASSFGHSDVNEGLRMNGQGFSSQGIGLHISSQLCMNNSKNSQCDWMVDSDSNLDPAELIQSWIFCGINKTACICGSKNVIRSSDNKCNQLDVLQNLRTWNTLIKHDAGPSVKSRASAISAASSLIYFSDNLHSSWHPGWLNSIAEFQLIIFPEDKSEVQWVGFCFGHLDNENYARFEMNPTLGIQRIRKRENGVSGIWDCSASSLSPAFIFGAYYTVRIEARGNSLEIFLIPTFFDELDNLYIKSRLQGQDLRPVCAMSFDKPIGPASSSFGFFAAGSGTVYFMNLHVYAPYVSAKHSNILSPPTKSVTMVGSGFGGASTSKMQIYYSACEVSAWHSDTIVVCRASQAFGGTLQYGVTVGLFPGTLTDALSCSTPLVSGIKALNNFQIIQSPAITVIGSQMGTSSNTAAVNLGVSCGESTSWVATSSIIARLALGLSGTLSVIITAGTLMGTATDLVSQDIMFVRSILKANTISTGGLSISVLGINLGAYASSIEASSGGTGCRITIWTSDTVLKCSSSTQMAGSGPAMLTGGARVGTKSSVFSADSSLLSQTHAANQASQVSSVVSIKGANIGCQSISSSLRVGSSGSEATNWISDSTLLGKPAFGNSRSRLLVVSNGINIGSQSSVMTYNKPIVLNANTYIQARTYSDVIIKGSGKRQYSVSIRTGFTVAESTVWLSESSITIGSPSGSGNGLRLAITVQSTIDTVTNAVLYNSPSVVSNISSVVRKIEGSWCAVENSTCRCSGIVQFKSLSGVSSEYTRSITNITCSGQQSYLGSLLSGIKSCFCFNWPFPGGQLVSIIGNGFGADDFTPKARVSVTGAPTTRWISESSVLGTLPTCTDCGSASMAQSIIISVAQQASLAVSFPMIFNFNVNSTSLCPFFWSTSGTQTLSSSSGYLCRTAYANAENISWIIDPCSTNNNCASVKSGNTASMVQARITFLSFNTVQNHGFLSVYACTTSECTKKSEKLKSYSGIQLPTPISGNPYLKVSWNADNLAESSRWSATWTTSYNISFQIFTSQLSYSAAEAACNALSTDSTIWHLASISSALEMSAIATLSSSGNVWIGLAYNGTKQSLGWTDGITYNSSIGDYNNWFDGNPLLPLSQYCIAAALNTPDSSWKSRSCSELLAYVCSNKNS